MKWIKFVIVLLSAMVVSELASADRYGHTSVGVVIGYPWGGYLPGYPYAYPFPYTYPYAYPVYPPTIVMQSPPVYVEQGAAPPAQVQASPGYWYYCKDPKGYYPYLKECPTGWQKVAPQLPASPTLPPPGQ